MVVVDTLIPDNEGNHLVVALYFYDDYAKVFYRSKHVPIIHCVTAHIEDKY